MWIRKSLHRTFARRPGTLPLINMTSFKKTEFSRRLAPAFVAFTLIAIGPANGVRAQTTDAPPVANDPESTAADQSSQQIDSLPALTKVETEEVQALVEMLGAPRFAKREQASAKLIGWGERALPILQNAASVSSDAEIRWRARAIGKRIDNGDLEVRITDFLAGSDVGLPGWETVRVFLGESNSAREIYVQMLRGFPDSLAALRGTPRDKVIAINEVYTTVRRRRRELITPTSADVSLMMMLSADPDVPTNENVESEIISALRLSTATSAFNDRQVGFQFRYLVGLWGSLSSESIRADYLDLAMAWDIPHSLRTAIKTLGESNSTSSIVAALQTISRFGDKRHLMLISPWYDSQKIISRRGFGPQSQVTVTIGDAALATATLLCKAKLGDVGFPKAAASPIRGFDTSQLGFLVADDSGRRQTRLKVDKLILDQMPKPIPLRRPGQEPLQVPVPRP